MRVIILIYLKGAMDKMGKDIKETIKETIKSLTEYRFDYKYPCEKYSLLYDINLIDKPVMIIGPEWGHEEELRVWAYGGSIAVISLEDGKISLCDKKAKLSDGQKQKNALSEKSYYSYGRYLINGFKDGKDHVFYLQDELKKKYIAADVYSVYSELICAHNRKKDDKEQLDKELLDLSVFAAYSRYLNRPTDGGEPLYAQEKSMQCVIAKNSMANSQYDKKEKSMVVVDVEFHLNANKSTGPRADFVVFDGKAFGLIEFKYLGLSMDGSDNSLEKHYTDFQIAAMPENAEKLVEELIRRMDMLIDYGVIDQSWNVPLKSFSESFGNNGYRNDMLWFGFYFVGDKSDIPGHVNGIVEDRVIKQIKDHSAYEKQELHLKYQKSECSKESVDLIKMDQDIETVWNKEEKKQ